MCHPARPKIDSSIGEIEMSLLGKSKQQVFWEWFQKNEDRIFNFERDQDRIFDDLATALRRVNRHLVFEFGSVEQGKREFVISAGGLKEYFPLVMELADSAPVLDRWQIIRFRPRREPTDIQIRDLTIRSGSDVFFTLRQEAEEKIGIRLYIKGYSEAERELFYNIGFLLLDHSIGEFDVATKVGTIIISTPVADAQPFVNLAKAFDEMSGGIGRRNSAPAGA